MDYRKIYTENYFSGKNSFFYKMTGGYRDVKRYFDNLAGAYAPHFEGGELLDVGCAYGYLLERFTGKASLYGFDVSEHAIEQARTLVPDALYATGSVTDGLPYGDESFNGVMMTDVIEHLTRDDQEQAVRELVRVLRPGGTLYLTTPNLNLVRRVIYGIPDRMEHHVGMMSLGELQAFLESFGLETRDAWSYLHGLIPVRLPPWLGPEAAVVAVKTG